MRPVVVRPEWAGSLVASAGGHLDVLVVDERPVGFDSAQVATLIGEAHRAGIPVVGVGATPGLVPTWSGQVDVRLVVDPDIGSGGELLVAAPAVDVGRFNPIGWRRQTTDRFAVVGDPAATPDGWQHATDRIGALVGWDQITLFGRGPAEVPHRQPAPTDPAALIATLRELRGVIDHPGLHPDVGRHAQLLLELCASGIPVVAVDLPEQIAALLGEPLARLLRTATVDDLTDPDCREQLSVRLRRAALTAHSDRTRWRQLAEVLGLPLPAPPTITVLLATNRPDFLDHAASQIAQQTYQPRTTVVVLHGDRFPPDTPSRLRDRLGAHTTILHAPTHYTLGDVLNLAADHATGEIITKMDDDDYYVPDHLTDLALALEYSGADLVGKAAEFVYLGDLDVTIRRFAGGAESPSRLLAGGAIAMYRLWLRFAGGWRRLPAAVDRALIDDVLSAGGRVYRTHGWGFVLNRHGISHTWPSDADYFLSQAFAEWRGLRLNI